MATAKTKQPITVNKSEPFYKRHFIPLCIFAFAFLLYANTIGNYYNLDDELVTRNQKLTSKGISAIPEIFTAPYYKDDMGYSYGYRPIVHTTFAIEHQFFGESPHVSHFFNALLFAVLCVLLYFLLRQMLPVPDILIVITMALFIAHPIHTEVVASIKNRDELLMFTFSALSLYALVKWLDVSFIKAISFGAIFFALSMLSKNSALPFAVLIPFSIVFFRNISFLKFSIISILLTAIGVPLLENAYLWYTVKIGLAIIVGNSIIYAAIIAIKNIDQFKNIFGKLNPTKVIGSTTEGLDGLLEIGFKKLEGIEWLPLLGVYATLGAAIYAMVADVWWLLYISVILVSLYGLLSKNRTNMLFLLPSFIVLLVFIQKVDEKWMGIHNIIGASLLALLYASTKQSRKSIFILAALFCLQWYINKQDLDFLFFVIVATSIIYRKYFTYLSIAMLAILVVATPIEIYRMFTKVDGYYSSYFITLVAIGAVTWWVYKNFSARKLLNILAAALLIFCLVEPLFFSLNSLGPNNVFQYIHLNSAELKRDYIQEPQRKIADVKMPKVVKVATDRPLNFIETPVPINAPIYKKTLFALDILLRYAKLLVLPYPLLYYYGYKVVQPVDNINGAVIISALVHLLLIGLALFYIRRQPFVSWAIFFYLVFMLTLANIFISIPGGMGERYLLVPSLCFCLLLAWLIYTAAGYIASKQGKDIVTSIKWLAIPVVLIYSGATLYRNALWKDDITLFTHDIEHAPESAQAHNLLAIHLMQKSFDVTDAAVQTDMRKQALYHFKETNRIYPQMFNAAYDIGRAYTVLGMPDSAIAAYKYASTLDTNFYNIQLSIAELYYAQAKYDEAIPYIEYCIRKLPSYYPSYEQLSYIFFLKKQYKASVDVNKLAIKNIPNTPEPYINIVRTFVGQNNIDSARYYAAEAYRIAPQNAMAQQMVRELGIAPN